MARLKLSEVQAEDGGAWLYGSFMGGFIAALRSLYIPPAGAITDVPNKHYTALCDLFFTISEQLANVSSFVIYRDGADADTEFRVLPFSQMFGGVECSYAGGAAIGGLVASTAKYIYADFSAAPTITIVVANAWPAASTPHIRGGVLTAPVTGAWKPANLVRKTAQQSIVIPGDAGSMTEINFTSATASPAAIVTVPAGRRIKRVVIDITTAFNGAPSLTVGDVGDVDRLMAAAEVDPLTVGRTIVEPYYKYTATGAINLYITPGGATLGAGTVIVE